MAKLGRVIVHFFPEEYPISFPDLRFSSFFRDTVRISCGVSGLSYWQYFRKRRGNMKSETIIY
ncbi:MAG: hypothetical protein PWQ92_774, partial [Thermococcaceae archaeon]|nr:hypothetical protein [Thermococcaceae archaeon]